MRSARAWHLRLFAMVTVLVLAFAACGGDDDDDDAGGGDTTDSTEEGEAGGEVIDIGTFPADPPDHIDPALNVTIDAYQVVNALYDGLTDFDATTDPANPTVEPLVAESWESSDDAITWTFTIKEGQTFSDGEEILPSSFVRVWERASDPDFAGSYSYLFNFIDGGAEKLDGAAETISGVVADDEAMTLTVTLDAPYANFDFVAGFQIFSPMPSAVDALPDQTQWENGVMIGNGPYKMESARTDQQIVLVRNDEWAGDVLGHTRATLDRITFNVGGDIDSAYNAFEAGEADVGPIPAGRFQEVDDNWETTLDTALMGNVFFEIDWEDPTLGGPDNVLLRQAISQAINREEISEAVYDGFRPPATGVAPTGVPGVIEDLCEVCDYDPEAAEAAFQEWQDAGHSQTGPIPIQFNAGAGWEPMVDIIVDNLAEVGIQAEAAGAPDETYFEDLSNGLCTLCRSGWYADYPTYDNFLYDLFHTDAIGGNNHGSYSNPEFDQMVDEAKSNPDEATRNEAFQEAERLLVNEDTGVIPIVNYVGDYSYNGDKISNFEQNGLGLILWETVTVNE